MRYNPHSNMRTYLIFILSPGQFHASRGVADWRLTSQGATALFRTRSFAERARFVQAIGALPGVEEHRPNVDVRRDGATST